jgi:hypothetical protein
MIVVTMFGGALFVIGFLIAAGMVFSHGGSRKSAQFRVIGEIMRGDFGPKTKLLTSVGALLMVAGACFAFSGVMMADAARERRCRQLCTSRGFSSGRIGPNSDRDPRDRATAFVACICEGPGREPLETRAE